MTTVLKQAVDFQCDFDTKNNLNLIKMKTIKTTLGILFLSVMSLPAFSCKENSKEKIKEETLLEKTVENTDTTLEAKMTSQNLLSDYIQLKNALVNDSENDAAETAKKMLNDYETFDISSYTTEQQNKLKDIILDAKEQVEHISESPIAHQREHFKQLSIDVMDMVKITGTSKILYQQFCPMYDRGSSWLSESKDIKNPFYGKKMLTCGSVKQKIN